MDPLDTHPRLRRLAWLIGLAAGAAGSWAGWRFGDRLDGVWLAVITALNGAAICGLVATAAAERVLAAIALRRAGSHRDAPQGRAPGSGEGGATA